MHATLHEIDGIPGPQDNTWVDEVLSAIRTKANPVGALVARTIGPGPGYVIALWSDADDAAAGAADLGSTGSVTVGAGRTYEIDTRQVGLSTSPAHYLQLLVFDGPRTPEWLASYERAGRERMAPATTHIPGLVEHIGGTAADGGKLSMGLAESMEAIEAAGVAIMSTELLPGENPEHLTGPDSFAILRLLHADVPVGASR